MAARSYIRGPRFALRSTDPDKVKACIKCVYGNGEHASWCQFAQPPLTDDVHALALPSAAVEGQEPDGVRALKSSNEYPRLCVCGHNESHHVHLKAESIGCYCECPTFTLALPSAVVEGQESDGVGGTPGTTAVGEDGRSSVRALKVGDPCEVLTDVNQWVPATVISAVPRHKEYGGSFVYQAITDAGMIYGALLLCERASIRPRAETPVRHETNERSTKTETA